MSAVELLHEIHDMGFHLVVRDGYIHCRSSEPLSDEIITRLRVHKAEVIQLLQRQQSRHGKPYLKNGELRVNGLLPPGAMLDTLLGLNASDDVVERYINPIGTHKSWARWQSIKPYRGIQ